MTNNAYAQLPLKIGLRQEASFESYVNPLNSEIIQRLQESLTGQGDKIIYLWANEGLGKTHLLHAACRQMIDLGQACVYIPLADKDLPLIPDILTGLERMPLVCIDDIQEVFNNPAWGHAILNLINRVKDLGHCLFLAGEIDPKQLDQQTPDLYQEMLWMPSYYLSPVTSQADFIEAVRLKAEYKGLELEASSIKYLVNRQVGSETGEAKLLRLFKELEQIDEVSLSQKRKPSLRFVKSLFEVKE